MNKDFYNKVIKNGIVDTKKYRYKLKEYADHANIERIDIKEINTTTVYTDWEVVVENVIIK